MGSAIYLNAVLFSQNTINGGGVAFHNSGYRLALGHVNDMRCLEKVHAFCLFDLILYIQSTIFQILRDGSTWVEPVLS